jgi:transporter family-2 protein
MCDLLSLLIGVIIAAMVAVNGSLTMQYGVFGATVIIHIVGSLFAFLFIKILRKNASLRYGIPLRLYMGGVVGVLTAVLYNFSYGKISLTSIVALSLWGQTAASLVIDSFGLFGMRKYPFKKPMLIGLSFSAIGILVMLDNSVKSSLYAVVLSLGAGITVVLSRTVNARLSERIGALQGSFINHVIGLPVAIAVLFIWGRTDQILVGFAFSSDVWIYWGGIMGVMVVMLSNIIVPKVPAFRLTLLSFIGQVSAGIALDLITKKGYSEADFIAGLLVSVGIGANMLIEQAHLHKERKVRQYYERIQREKEAYLAHLLALAEEPFLQNPDVVFDTRPKNGICCPHCWTIQPSIHNHCSGYQCGSNFIFLDEADREKTDK